METLPWMLTADRGEAFGEDYYFAHGHSVGLYPIRVPLLHRPARATRARTIATRVSTLDVAPTLLREVGLDVPAEFQGVALDPTADARARAEIRVEEGDPAQLEPALAEFLDAAYRRTPLEGSEVPEAMREQLRALGYLE